MYLTLQGRKYMALKQFSLQSKKVKQSRYRPEQAQRVDRGIALPLRDLSTRRGCVVSITPWLLYPWQRPSTHCIGRRVGLGPVRTGEENLAPTGVRSRTVRPVASHYTD
jgi:hypothetical protein